MPGDDEGHIDEPVTPPEGGDGKVGVRFTVEQMMALLTAIIEKYESFAHLDRGSQNEQIVKYLSTRPEVEASEAGPGGAWVHFTDGGWLFLDNRDWAGTD